MSTKIAVWHGDPQDWYRLQRIVDENCPTVAGCVAGERSLPPGGCTCQAHRMLTDQYALDHMAEVLHNRVHFSTKERTAVSSRQEDAG